MITVGDPPLASAYANISIQKDLSDDSSLHDGGATAAGRCRLLVFHPCRQALRIDATKRLDDFDAFMAKSLKDRNAAGGGAGIVVSGKLVFAKGCGYQTM